jgi:hypothetical protein
MGEFETELTLPIRVEYRMDAQGEIDITALTPLDLHFHHLPRPDQRTLRQSAETHATAQQTHARTAHALEYHESRDFR